MIGKIQKNALLGFITFLVFLLLSTHSFAQENKELKAIIATGLGEDVADAAQNAAQNALVEVVGSFLDATKLLEKKAEIQSGIRSETKTITTDIKEYSQGSIKSFEILDAADTSGLIKVTAKVTVRIEDFKAYVKELAHTETNIDGEGLFAQVAVKKKQSKNKIGLLHDNILEPLLSGEVLEFTIGKPVLYENADIKQDSYRKLDRWATRTGKEDIIGFQVDVNVKKGFIENMKNTLDHLADNKEEIFYRDLQWGIQHKFRSLGVDLMADFPVIVNSSEGVSNSQPTADVYIIRDAQHKLSKTPYGACITDYNCTLDVQNLEIHLKDDQGEILQSENSAASKVVYIHTSPGNTLNTFGEFGRGRKAVGVGDIPWMMGAASGMKPTPDYLFIAENRSFWVFMKVSPDALKNAKAISVSLVE